MAITNQRNTFPLKSKSVWKPIVRCKTSNLRQPGGDILKRYFTRRTTLVNIFTLCWFQIKRISYVNNTMNFFFTTFHLRNHKSSGSFSLVYFSSKSFYVFTIIINAVFIWLNFLLLISAEGKRKKLHQWMMQQEEHKSWPQGLKENFKK